MGILSEAVKTQNQLRHATTKEMKRNFVIERLTALKVTHSQTGISINDLDYDELKYELVLASFREIDVNNPENGWF